MTAVEWLITELEKNKFITKSQIFIAEEMEREIIKTAFEEGMFHHISGFCPEEYYEEKFKLK
jgi:hypothetical protein